MSWQTERIAELKKRLGEIERDLRALQSNREAYIEVISSDYDRIQTLEQENRILRDMLRAAGWSNDEIQAAVDVLTESRHG